MGNVNKRNLSRIFILRRDENGNIILNVVRHLEEPYKRKWEAYDEFSGDVYSSRIISDYNYDETDIDVDALVDTSNIKKSFKKELYGRKDRYFFHDEYDSFLEENCGIYDFFQEKLGENDNGEYIILLNYIPGSKYPGECTFDLYDYNAENLEKVGLFEYTGEQIDEEYNYNGNMFELYDHGLYDSYKIKSGSGNSRFGYDYKSGINPGDVYSKKSKEMIENLGKENFYRHEMHRILSETTEISTPIEEHQRIQKEIADKLLKVEEKKGKKITTEEILEAVDLKESDIREIIDETLDAGIDKESKEKDGQTQADE